MLGEEPFQGTCESRGIEAAGVRDDFAAALGNRGRVGPKLVDEIIGITATRVRTIARRERRERNLREVIAHENVDRIAAHHLVDLLRRQLRFDSIARVCRAVYLRRSC